MNGDPMAADGALLEVTGLGVRFPTPRGELVALSDVSLEVRAGRTTAIVGESGSGKSVLARSIMGLLPRKAIVAPASSVRFDGRELIGLSAVQMETIRGRRIAMVFQDPMTALNPVRTIGAQLAEGVRRHLGLDGAAARRRALSLLERVGIASPAQRLDQYPHQLSGGMRQRVVIAMAIACEPQLLIADEPTTALDVTVQAEILALLAQLQREQRMAMILVTHDLGVAAGHADQVIVMYAGQVVETAATRALFHAPAMPYTQALLRAIPRLSDDAHVRLETIPGRPPTIIGNVDGCRFRPRCTRASERCAREAPVLERGPDGRAWRCWHPGSMS